MSRKKKINIHDEIIEDITDASVEFADVGDDEIEQAQPGKEDNKEKDRNEFLVKELANISQENKILKSEILKYREKKVFDYQFQSTQHIKRGQIIPLRVETEGDIITVKLPSTFNNVDRRLKDNHPLLNKGH